ncbi:hypothetical protein FACS189473_3590 [Spirochaetia bacterium]|nr:hypothetical protein FACS189473_3590 [Spirochaetia bacterium]
MLVVEDIDKGNAEQSSKGEPPLIPGSPFIFVTDFPYGSQYMSVVGDVKPHKKEFNYEQDCIEELDCHVKRGFWVDGCRV